MRDTDYWSTASGILYPASCILYAAPAMRCLDSITPIILAAGDSTRMGYPKALLPIENEVFLTRVMGIVRKIGLADPVIILGRAAGMIQPAIADRPARIRINQNPDRGQLSSIQLGLSSLDAQVEACMIWPVDQPAVSETLVYKLAQLFVQSECLLAFLNFEGKRGHPAIFHRALFREFLDAPLEAGPKGIILRHLQDIAELTADESAIIQDIDTPTDYEALTGESVQTALARQAALKS
jgi:molybdenum cofactor cytidylyltransferase